MTQKFREFAAVTSKAVGSPLAFFISVFSVLLWAIVGPIFHYSDTWQLVINTSTTIITFWICVLIQNTQNRFSSTIELKLNEIIRALPHASNKMLDLDKLNDSQFEELKTEYKRICLKAS